MLRRLMLSVMAAMLAPSAHAAERNVVLLVADDHGADALGADGNRVVKTPSLDQRASERVRFTRALAGALTRGLTMCGPRTVQAYTQRPAFELYELLRDPLESTNLAADATSAQILAELKAGLKAFQDRTGDPWVIKWQYG